MNEYEEKLKKYIDKKNILCEHLSFKQSCHSVEEAAQTVNTNKDNFVKNICFIDSNGNLIVAIVKGEDRVNISLIKTILNTGLRTATSEEILQKTGYPCGGIPSFGYNAKFIIDTKVLEKENIYSGGGSENSLIKISSLELQKSNHGTVIMIRK